MSEMNVDNVGEPSDAQKHHMFVVKTIEFLFQGAAAKRDAMMRELARTRVCHTCAFWDQDVQNPGQGQCRRKAPDVAALQNFRFNEVEVPLPGPEGVQLTKLVMPMELATGFQKVFIGTGATDWCGDWARFRPLFGILNIFGKG